MAWYLYRLGRWSFNHRRLVANRRAVHPRAAALDQPLRLALGRRETQAH